MISKFKFKILNLYFFNEKWTIFLSEIVVFEKYLNFTLRNNKWNFNLLNNQFNDRWVLLCNWSKTKLNDNQKNNDTLILS